MKKYITPAAEVLAFNTETHMMLSVSSEVSPQPQLSIGRDDDFSSDWDEEE